jgi:hypothetical protein
MTDTALAPGKLQLSLLQLLSLLFGVIGAVLAIYFWVQTARFGESLAGPWYALSALTFSVLATVASGVQHSGVRTPVSVSPKQATATG